MLNQLTVKKLFLTKKAHPNKEYANYIIKPPIGD
ncbi:hypothetical protein SAMN04487990_10257 [Bizionia paragorgiae]|uniref:Uncharacterized protein n=1 Tax=Bizionia paragorgiae TaxID=283786 RepID=A0A1H3VVA7_BIZPA|nr:hypothetical protein SAMN04487990_10257 [Bizionia paragorgiae]